MPHPISEYPRYGGGAIPASQKIQLLSPVFQWFPREIFWLGERIGFATQTRMSLANELFQAKSSSRHEHLLDSG